MHEVIPESSRHVSSHASIDGALTRPAGVSIDRERRLLDLAEEVGIGGRALGLLEQIDIAGLDAHDRVRFLQVVTAQAAWMEAFHTIALAAVCGPVHGWPEDDIESAVREDLADLQLDDASAGERLRAESEARSHAWDTRERAIALEVSLATRVSTRTASRRIEGARFLTQEIPQALDEAWAGRWGYGHLRVAEKELAEVSPDVRAEVLSDVLPYAATDHPRRLTDRLRKSIARRDADGMSDRTRAKSAQRDVGMWTLADGQSRLAITGPHAVISQIHRDVLDVARARKAVMDARPDDFPAEDRLVGAVRVDTVREGLARLREVVDAMSSPAGPSTVHSVDESRAGNLASDVHSIDEFVDPWLAPDGNLPLAYPPGSRPRQEAAVVIDVATALGMANEPAFVPGYGWIPAPLGREILADSPRWRRWLIDDRSRQLVEVGKDRYRPSQALRDLVAARDVTCTADTCNRPATHSQLDHAIDFDGTNTTPDNLHAACGPDHMAITAGYFVVGEDDRGHITWTSTVSDHSYPSHPHPLYDVDADSA